MRKKISAVLFTGVMVGMLYGGSALAADCKTWPNTQPPNSALPGTPVVVATAGDGQVKLDWAAVNTGTANTVAGDQVDGYFVFYTEASCTTGNEDLWALQYVDAGKVLTYTVTGLTNGTAYQFKVIAADSYKKGPSTVTDYGAEQSSAVLATPAGGGGTTTTTGATTTTTGATTTTTGATTTTTGATTTTTGATTTTTGATTTTTAATTTTTGATTTTTKAPTTTTTSTTTTTLAPLANCDTLKSYLTAGSKPGKGMDVNGDAEVNALDAALIVRYLKNCK